MEKLCAILGDINIDIITPPFEIPKDFGESSIVLDEFTNSLGGNAINVAATLTNLNADCTFFGAMGDGPISKWIINKCNNLKIKTKFKILNGKSSGITFAMTFIGGKRQFIATLGTNALLELDHLNRYEILLADHFHRSGFWYTPKLIGEPTIQLMKNMISKNKQTSLDVGWDPLGFPDKNREILYKTLEYTEYFFANEKEIKAITKTDNIKNAIEEILEISNVIDNPKLILHQGPKGSSIITKKNNIKIPTRDVPQINPTGTGDVYNGGFIYGLLNNWALKECGIFADKVACVHLSNKNIIYPKLKDIK